MIALHYKRLDVAGDVLTYVSGQADGASEASTGEYMLTRYFYSQHVVMR
jgi:hypothetical protein